MSWVRERCGSARQWRAILGSGCALGAIAVSLVASPAATAATVPYAYDMDKEAGFVMDPNEHKRVGYVTALQFGSGTGSVLATDLKVADPTKSTTPPPTLNVVAVMSRFEWNGAVGDPLKIEAYVSQANAYKIKSRFAQASALITGLPLTFNYAVLNYDQELKRWFTQAKPTLAPVSTTVAVSSLRPQVSVDLNPVPAKDGIDVNVYRLSFAAAAPIGSEPLTFQTTATKQVSRPWGLLHGGPVGETEIALEPEAPPAASPTPSTRCASARRIVIHLPRSWRRATVAVAGRNVRVRRLRGRLTATIDLRGSKRATVTVTARGSIATAARCDRSAATTRAASSVPRPLCLRRHRAAAQAVHAQPPVVLGRRHVADVVAGVLVATGENVAAANASVT